LHCIFFIFDSFKSRQHNINVIYVICFVFSAHNEIPVQFQYISLIQVHCSTLLKFQYILSRPYVLKFQYAHVGTLAVDY